MHDAISQIVLSVRKEERWVEGETIVRALQPAGLTMNYLGEGVAVATRILWGQGIREQWAHLIALFVRRFRRRRGDEFLETRVVPKRVEHRIEPEQRRSKRQVRSQWAFIRYRE
jgi:hypothetical protein